LKEEDVSFTGKSLKKLELRSTPAFGDASWDFLIFSAKRNTPVATNIIYKGPCMKVNIETVPGRYIS